MKQRGKLQSIIIKAWKDCIENEYCEQRINSESSLLVFFCHHLMKNLRQSNRRIFVEPEIRIDSKTKIIPDIAICNSREVIGIIELKYLPRAQPKYTKDINSMIKLRQNWSDLFIKNERFLGKPADDKVYKFSENILFVWAGIHKKTNSRVFIEPILQNCFLELHAETLSGNNPEISSIFNNHATRP